MSLTAHAEVPTYPPIDQVRKDFVALLQRPLTDFKPSFVTTKTDDLVIERGSITTEVTEKVPVVIYKPVITGQTSFPVVIFLHGTGGNKENGEMKPMLEQFAQAGIMGVAIDARFHGDRIPGGAHGAQEYTDAAYNAWKNTDPAHQTHPFLMDTAYDLWRLVDYLVTRPDVKADRIGMGGVSMGGIETWMAASVDVRIKATVSILSAQSFKWSLENDQWQGRTGTIGDAHKRAAHDLGDDAVNQTNVKAVWDKLLPGITGEFDCPSMLRLFAPRPLLLISKDKDPNNPFPGAQIAFESVRNAYKEKNALDSLDIEVTPNQGHEFNEDDIHRAVEWFKKWLLN